MPPGSPPELEPLRRETFEGLEIASDPAEREYEEDFVLGAGPASRLLARLTIRQHANAVLDLGTGSGVQALLASRHADRVVAVDVNSRALAIGELNARSNGIVNVEWRKGSWLEPVWGERFDLVVSNPPYVISPDSSYSYRDSGEHMDALVLRLLVEIPGVL
ncbi:MAG: methyltransferase, partial [Gaiellaceae bacterium]